MKKYFRLASITSIIAIAALTLTACGHHSHSPEDKAEWLQKKLARKLDLTDEQQAKLKAVTDLFVEHHKAQKDKRMQHMDDILAQVKQPALDKQALQSMFDEHQRNMAELAPQFIDRLAEFHASLNDEQKQKLAKKLEKFKKYHHDED